MAAIAYALIDALWLEQFFFRTSHFHREKSGTDPLRILQLSDLHLHHLRYRERRLAEHINALKPDLLLITGDVIDDGNNLALLDAFFAMLDPAVPKKGITGNWEYWGDVDLKKLAAVYKKHNGELLINEARQLRIRDRSLAITGVDDWLGGKPDIDAALKNHVKSDHHIVMNHCPVYSEVIGEKLEPHTRADFILSGHTHGGQITLFGFAPFLPQGSGRYRKGWFRMGSTDMYVSTGVGTSMIPVRFMARAEIAMFYI
ncbi:MAG: metallophosphoesterase [Mucilaginibacter polytrichastri]|nr:metallophosphoesterase [Mucilaginibacter polytrichastri]